MACLELGSASVMQISRKAALPRSTCEVILDKLQDEGWVSSFRKKRIRHFSAEDPHKIIQLAKEKVRGLERALPEFMASYGHARVRPTVRFYQGKDGMRLILEEVLAEADELLGFSSATDLFDTLSEYFPEFVKRRVERKIPAKVLLRDSPKARERQRLGPQQLREVRIIPEGYEYHAMMYVWKNKIAMFSFEKDLVGLVIESEELAKLQRAMFYLIWHGLR